MIFKVFDRFASHFLNLFWSQCLCFWIDFGFVHPHIDRDVFLNDLSKQIIVIENDDDME